MDFDPAPEYPLGTHKPELVATPSGLSLDDITLDALRAERLRADDIRARPQTLRLQAEVAAAAGRAALAASLARAAELASVPSETILEIYTALRPRRASAEDLDSWATRLETQYEAPLTAAFVREAAAVYAQRGLLRREASAPQALGARPT